MCGDRRRMVWKSTGRDIDIAPLRACSEAQVQNVRLVGKVGIADIGGIKEGNRANFTVDAFPKRTFAGTVSQVRQSPQTLQNVVTYDVVVGVGNSDLALKPGMTATTRVAIAERNDVLRVSSQALRYSPAGLRGKPSDRSQVWVLRDEKPVAVTITTGLDDDTFAEIVQGELQPDDKVIVSEQREAARAALPPPRF